MTQPTRTYRLDAEQAATLRTQLNQQGFEFRPLQWAHWQARSPDATVSLYRSGKLVLQARSDEDLKDLSSLVLRLGARDTNAPSTRPAPFSSSASSRPAAPAYTGPASSSSPGRTVSKVTAPITTPVGPFAPALARFPAPIPGAWIGIDETGKGDYFGPLVVCAVRVELEQLPLLAELGAADSKTVTDKQARAIAATLAKVVPHDILSIGPERYNALYAEIGNLNHLLAWAHAKCAANVLEKADAELILSDAFSQRELVREKLSGRARSLRYQQRTRAEDDPAVACASILARAHFLDALDELGRTHGVQLAKGAGSPVLVAGRAIVARHGADMLANVAKLHFRTTQKLTGEKR